jgi:hypothetical protein
MSSAIDFDFQAIRMQSGAPTGRQMQMVSMVNQMEPLQVVEVSGNAMVGVSIVCLMANKTWRTCTASRVQHSAAAQ